METFKKIDNPGDCPSTGTILIETVNKNKNIKNENQNINIDSATATTNLSSTTTTATTIIVKHATSPTMPGATNKLKSQQQQQHQFRTPQQFVKHKKTSSSTNTNTTTSSSSSSVVNTTATSSSLNNNKKNKCWNKRQNRTTKQNNNTTSNINTTTTGGIANNTTSSSKSNSNTTTNEVPVTAATTHSGTENEHENETKTNLSATSKADLENIQNLKNQVGGHYHHHHHHHAHANQQHHYHNQHHGASSNNINNMTGQGGFPPSCLSAMASEKLGYGHGHCKQNQTQLHKKPLPAHRSGSVGGVSNLGGNHHHILCAGSAHNTLGTVGPGAGNAAGVTATNLTCCHINGCPSHNLKDVNSANNSTASSAASTLHICCLRSKFFLPDKRPRKGNFIPPTKFLLGGNISDPLNLSSLQNEASNASSNNNTPATTPRQSPITTPPKVEVIIPPNIHDPLHLLDPVDSMEYEKQLTSPMKRGLGMPASLVLGLRGGQLKTHKHRHRKNRKPKRRRYDSLNSTTSTVTTIDSLDTERGVSISMDFDPQTSTNSAGSEDEELTENELLSPQQQQQQHSVAENIKTTTTANSSISITTDDVNAVTNAATINTASDDNSKIKEATQQAITPPAQLAQQLHQELQPKQENKTVLATSTVETLNNVNTAGAATNLAQTDVAATTVARERACRDLRLDLVSTTTCSGSASTTSCGSSIVSGGGGNGRKRKVSESNSQKGKVSYLIKIN